MLLLMHTNRNFPHSSLYKRKGTFNLISYGNLRLLMREFQKKKKIGRLFVINSHSARGQMIKRK